ncbi:Crp/Fnr family transcriptional regulator [Mucilaginibacter ximonensis]|uniref:Crp/Fnr family transcriptional regulator n=1 Tax=Mucilaginibacter ximonensis TaxID=538021 RepID=A0ABW5Y9K7_9SPHI
MKKHQPILDQLFKVLDGFKPQPQAYYDHLAEVLHPQYFPDDQVLFEQGDTVQHGYFLASGFAISYYYNDQGEKQVIRIYQQNEIIKGKSFTQQSPSAEYLMICADSYVLSVSHQDMETIYERFPSVAELSRIVLAHREVRELEHKQLLAKETLLMVEAFYKAYPGLSDPGKVLVDADIASYLLISGRTLRASRAQLKLT